MTLLSPWPSGFLGRGRHAAYTVVPVILRGCEYFEAKIIIESDIDFTLLPKELADRYGQPLTGNDRKGQRRTLDPVPTAEKAMELCELAYKSNQA